MNAAIMVHHPVSSRLKESLEGNIALHFDFKPGDGYITIFCTPEELAELRATLNANAIVEAVTSSG